MANTLEEPAVGLIERPRDYDEMSRRARFQPVLDRGQHELAEVLAPYSFAALCRCGLSECRQQHRAGFLVLTTDGFETNVGHVCGRNFFGESFEIKAQAQTRARERAELLARASGIKAKAPSLKRRFRDLNEGRYGLRWSDQVCLALANVLGDFQWESLALAARRSDLRVEESRERSEEEVKEIVERTGQISRDWRYETVTLGTIAPMPWMAFDVRSSLREGLLVPLERFLAADVDALPLPKLRQEVKRFDGAEEVLDRAETAIAAVVPFMAPANLQLVAEWLRLRQSGRHRQMHEWVGSRPYQALMLGLEREG